MKMLFVTNLPSPYRVDFFNELGKYCDLTVCYERRSATDRNEKWKGTDSLNFQEIYADVTPIGTDQSRGAGIKEIVKSSDFDHLIVSGYASPSVMSAIIYCKLHRIPYCMEYDGGFNKKDPLLKGLLKKVLLKSAKAHFTTCQEHKSYLLAIGIKEKDIIMYPFTSVGKKDIVEGPSTVEEKRALREELGIKEEKMILSVGQFIHRKGYDVLLEAAKKISQDVGIYIVGGEPTDEYLRIKEELKLQNVHFVGFKKKNELAKYYLASDMFVLPTREDIWGLVINEAMAKGLPVITTDRCIAGLELVENGENGYIIPIESAAALADRINLVIHEDKTLERMGKRSIEKIGWYTFESMAQVHIDYMKGR